MKKAAKTLMNIKKLIAILTAALIAVTAVGCGGVTEEDTAKQGERLVIAFRRDNTGTIKKILERFADSRGISVKLMELSDRSAENHRILSSVLAGNEVTVDVMIVEDILMKEFVAVGYLKPLDKSVSLDAAQYPSRFSDIIYDKKTLYGVPFELDAGVMFYRSDITDGTLNYMQLLDMPSLSYSIQGVDDEEMVCVVQECVRLAGGVREGVQLYKELVENSEYASDNYLTDFKSGNAAYARSWTSSNRLVQDNFGVVRGKVKTKLPIKDGRVYSTARAYCVTVNKCLDRDKNADTNALLEFLLRDDVQLELVKGLGTLPIKYSYYDNPMVRDYNEYNEEIAGRLDELNYRAADKSYFRYSDAAQKAVREYIDGSGTLDDAAAAMQKTMETD